jgi:glycosyltransferase involved in cell wall biosynthesis
MISILLATYNGDLYLEEQLRSIFSQTFQNFRLYIVDDCSTDDTYEILDKWKKIYPDKIFLERRNVNSGKPQIPFMELIINNKDTEYYMLCDQDDFWLKDKLQVSLYAIQKIEKAQDRNTPILLKTQYVLTNKDLVPYSNGKKMQEKTKAFSFKELISTNSFTGCTVIFNKALSKKFLSIPENCAIHDWLIAFSASVLGLAIEVPIITTYYRQHANNAIGVSNRRKLKSLFKRITNIHRVDPTIVAKNYLELFSDQTGAKEIEVIEDYINLFQKNIIQRYKILSKNNLWAPGLIRKVVQLIR